MDLASLRVFFQTAPLIYSSIARQAAENRSTAQLDQLRRVQERFVQACRDRDVDHAVSVLSAMLPEKGAS